MQPGPAWHVTVEQRLATYPLTHTHTPQAADSDSEARYLVLNAVANQLRYPNSHTHYFSCVLLTLFAEAKSDAVKEQITRVLLERLIVNRPHPWVSGCVVLYTWCVKRRGERQREGGITRVLLTKRLCV